MIASNGYAQSYFKVARLYFNTFLVVVRNDVWHGKKETKKKRMYVRENSSTRSVYGLKEPPTTVKTKYSAYFIYSNKDKKVRLRQVNRNIWFCLGFLSESSMIFPIRTHQMSSEAREKSKDPNVSDEKMNGGGKLYNNPKEEKKKKKRFFFGFGFSQVEPYTIPPAVTFPRQKKKKK